MKQNGTDVYKMSEALSHLKQCHINSHMMYSPISFGITILVCVSTVYADCDQRIGPSGNTECVLLTGYFGHQWATCLSKTYIRLISYGMHTCATTVDYCYNQCMMELNNKENGTIYPECDCSPGEVPKLSIVVPNWCYSPDGTDCSFFQSCLAKKYRCSASGNKYVLDFGEAFCHLYEEHSSWFTPKAQTWINAVRKCLQVELVPFLRPYQNPSCSEIKTKAIDSRQGCYIEPFVGAPNLCDLSIYDWLQLMATLRYPLDWRVWREGAFDDIVNIYNEGLTLFLSRCLAADTTLDVDTLVAHLEVDYLTSPELGDFMFGLANQIRNAMTSMYNPNDILVYPYVSTSSRKKREEDYEANTFSDIGKKRRIVSLIGDGNVYPFYGALSRKKRAVGYSGNVDIHILILERFKYDLNYLSGKTVNIDDAINFFLKQVTSKSFSPNLPLGVRLKTYFVCYDLHCKNIGRIVAQPVGTTTTSTTSRPAVSSKPAVSITKGLLFTPLMLSCMNLI